MKRPVPAVFNHQRLPQVPLLGEEEREARQVDLGVIDLDLREIRVHRHIEREPLRDLSFRLAADLEVFVESRLAGCIVTGRGSQHIWRHGRRPAKGGLEPGQVAGEIEPVEVELTGHGGPKDLFVQPPHPPGYVEPPGLGVGPVAKGAEGDPEFGVPTIPVLRGGDLPASIPVLVEAASGSALKALLGVGPAAQEETAATSCGCYLAVVLDAGRGRAEDEPVLLVVERVEDHDDRVRVGDLVVADRVTWYDAVRL